MAVSEWGPAERLPVTTDAGLWALTRLIVPESERFSNLETAKEGRPVASTNPDLRFLFPQPKAHPLSELEDDALMLRWADGNYLPAGLRSQYQWVSERGDQLRIDERQAALRTYLNSSLDRASELVKLHLAEWLH